MSQESFERRVREIDRRVREIAAEVSHEIELRMTGESSATWERAGSRAILTQHDGTPPHFELTIHTGSDDHPDALEIGIDDADVVDMVAQPIAEPLVRAT
jgi:hypothetical protein